MPARRKKDGKGKKREKGGQIRGYPVPLSYSSLLDGRGGRRGPTVRDTEERKEERKKKETHVLSSLPHY